MSGGITQLVAVGAQDVHLVGNPEVSFFQSSYKRHSNFSSVVERQVIQNVPANNGLSSIRFERKGDMLSYVYFVPNSSQDSTFQTNWSTVIDKVELYIGGQLIDTQHFEYSTKIHTDIMANSFSKSAFGSAPTGADASSFFYPLKFWFGENWQSALPLIALQYHDVEVRIYWGTDIRPEVAAIATAIANYQNAQTAGFDATKSPATHADRAALEAAFKAAADAQEANTGTTLVNALAAAGLTYTVDAGTGLITGDVLADSGASNWTATSLTYPVTETLLAVANSSKLEAWTRYIYLDTDERRMMAEKPMDMLIHQVQRIPNPESKTADLTFNHPVKFLASTGSNFGATNRLLLQLNGVDIGEQKQSVPHYKQVSSYYHTQFGADPASNDSGFESVTLMIPFCLDASKLQPTGSCNFSRMDSATLRLPNSTINAAIYAVNYNVLRIQNGMGGLLYAN
jgi:hypothetical protein